MTGAAEEKAAKFLYLAVAERRREGHRDARRLSFTTVGEFRSSLPRNRPTAPHGYDLYRRQSRLLCSGAASVCLRERLSAARYRAALDLRVYGVYALAILDFITRLPTSHSQSMSTLDPRSLVSMAGFMALVMAVVLGFMRRYYPPSILGLGYWAWTPVVWMVSAGLLASPTGGLFDNLRLAGNGLLVGGFALYYIGTRRFFAQPSAIREVLAGMGLLMLVLAWFTWSSPWYGMRLALVTLAIGALEVATLWFLRRHAKRSFPVRMLQITLLLHLIVLLVRLVKLGADDPIDTLMVTSTAQSLFLGAFVVCALLVCIAAVLMAADRIRTEFEHMATHDSLTGTLNRRAILGFCEDEHERSARYGQPFSLMMIDLDHFKALNDTHGHQHGDRVLVHFVECTRAALRRADRLGRYGGEEFLVLLPHTDTGAALPVAERIRTALTAGHALDCTASIGLTHWCGPEDTLDTMLGRADAALYQAKAEGRNRTCVG